MLRAAAGNSRILVRPLRPLSLGWQRKADRSRMLCVSSACAATVRHLFWTEVVTANSTGIKEYLLVGTFLVGILHHLRG